jgi:hypothetical protein
MRGKRKKDESSEQAPPGKTPTFLLELPLVLDAGQAKRVRAHLEAGRLFYNAVLSEGWQRLKRMRADPAWHVARALPRTQKPERAAAFSALRAQYGFSEVALHAYAKEARVAFLAEHLDAVLAQTLASRAYQALNRVCVGQAKRVRFRSRRRGLDSIENKRNDTGLRFVLQKPEEGQQGYLIWKEDQLAARIDWNDPLVKYSLAHRIKYARLIRRKASSPQAQGPMQRAFATSCNSHWKACPTTSPSTRSAVRSLAQIWGLPPSRSFPTPQQPASLSSAKNWPPMRRNCGGSSAKWSVGSVEAPLRTPAA